MPEESFQRARSREQKARRREAILSAAADLARQHGVREISLGEIARAVSIHKSGLLRYFETREEIFLELAEREWVGWRRAMVAALAEIAPRDAGAVAAALAQGFVERPLLCDLLPHAALNLERHASIEAVRAYKLTSIGSVEAVANALSGPLPDASEGERLEVVAMVSLLAGSMYQIATPPPALAELYTREPGLGHSLLDLDERLRRAARVVIAGLRSLAQ